MRKHLRWIGASALAGALVGCEGAPGGPGEDGVGEGLTPLRPEAPEVEARRTTDWAQPAFEARRMRWVATGDAGSRRVTVRVADPDGRTFSASAGPGEPVEFTPMSGDGLYRYELIAAATLAGRSGDGALYDRRDTELKAMGLRHLEKQFGVFRVRDGQIVDPRAKEVSE